MNIRFPNIWVPNKDLLIPRRDIIVPPQCGDWPKNREGGFIRRGTIGPIASSRRRSFAAFTVWVNFRDTAGYVTDGTNQTYCLGEAYPTTRGGATFGWESGFTSTNRRNRTTSLDPRLAGICFAFDPAAAVFRLDLPAAGTYDVSLALGDASAGLSIGGAVKDTSTVKITIPNAAFATNNFVDATNTSYTGANWPGSNTSVSVVFSTTIMRYVMSATGDINVIASIGVNRTA